MFQRNSMTVKSQKNVKEKAYDGTEEIRFLDFWASRGSEKSPSQNNYNHQTTNIYNHLQSFPKFYHHPSPSLCSDKK